MVPKVDMRLCIAALGRVNNFSNNFKVKSKSNKLVPMLLLEPQS